MAERVRKRFVVEVDTPLGFEEMAELSPRDLLTNVLKLVSVDGGVEFRIVEEVPGE